jgi:hypothetical protein
MIMQTALNKRTNNYVKWITMKVLLIITTSLFFAATRITAQTGKIEIRFEHCIGKKILVKDSSYSNAFNEIFTVSKFKYYISNLCFSIPSIVQQQRITANCFLIDEADPRSKTISMQVPAGSYDSIQFLLGVDSIKNISGAQTGALDPLNDMFWTWNTGYVMAKLEGNSPVSKLPQRMIEYHIGGFRGQYSVLQPVHLSATAGKKIIVKKNKTTRIVIETDMMKWFSSKHTLKIADYPACTSPCALALRFAENYAGMFSIQSIQYP